MSPYKTLDGSFIGDLAVDPTHLRDLLRLAQERQSDSGTMMEVSG